MQRVYNEHTVGNLHVAVAGGKEKIICAVSTFNPEIGI
jgi:hypothetical protein